MVGPAAKGLLLGTGEKGLRLGSLGAAGMLAVHHAAGSKSPGPGCKDCSCFDIDSFSLLLLKKRLPCWAVAGGKKCVEVKIKYVSFCGCLFRTCCMMYDVYRAFCLLRVMVQGWVFGPDPRAGETRSSSGLTPKFHINAVTPLQQ